MRTSASFSSHPVPQSCNYICRIEGFLESSDVSIPRFKLLRIVACSYEKWNLPRRQGVRNARCKLLPKIKVQNCAVDVGCGFYACERLWYAVSRSDHFQARSY